MKFTKGLIAGGVLGAMLSSKVMNQGNNKQTNQNDQSQSNVTNTEYIKETSVLTDDTMI